MRTTFACDAIHDADYVLEAGSLRHPYVAVSNENDLVALHLDDSVDDVVSLDVFYQSNSTFLDVLFLPWAKCYLVAKMYEEWVHAVALYGERDCFPFRNQEPYLLHHYSFVFYDRFRH